MIVYVESNFVLELALSQEETDSAKAIIDLGKAHRIELVVPAFALVEPFWTMAGRKRNWRETIKELNHHRDDLNRSSDRKALADLLGGFIQGASYYEEFEEESLENVVFDLLQSATILPIEQDVIQDALHQRRTTDLEMPDSIVLASILQHLESALSRSESVFVTKDRKDFGDPVMKETLRQFGCTLVTNFRDGLQMIRSRLEPK